jgi:hypothetical protein
MLPPSDYILGAIISGEVRVEGSGLVTHRAKQETRYAFSDSGKCRDPISGSDAVMR